MPINDPTPLFAAVSARRATPRSRVVVGASRPLQDNLNWITSASGSNSMNTRSLLVAPAGSDVSDIVLRFPRFYNGAPEADFPLSYTVTASIEYPVGTFTQAFFNNGATSLSVTAGRRHFESDPVPLYIPRGATFYVKCFLSWTGGVTNFPLNSSVQAANGEWCNVGTGLTDQTQTATVQTHSYAAPGQANGYGFEPMVLGRLSDYTPVLALIGDSITQGTVVTGPDSATGEAGWSRAFRGAIPVVNLARQAEVTSNFTSRPHGRLSLIEDAVTHAVVAYGRNDVTALVAAATIVANARKVWDLLRTRGIKVFAATVTPVTTSSDTWATTSNQTVSSPQEVIRLAYNTLLRDNWQTYGLSGVIDFARAVDPSDTGKWGADSVAGKGCYGVPTIVGNTITAVGLPTFTAGATSGGASYPINLTGSACTVLRHPDDPIRTGDATITFNTNGSGVVTAFNVVAGGSYSVPPMITPPGPWSHDGTHPTPRGQFQMIVSTGLGANLIAAA